MVRSSRGSPEDHMSDYITERELFNPWLEQDHSSPKHEQASLACLGS